DGRATLRAIHLHDQGSNPVSVQAPTLTTRPSVDYRGETGRQDPPSTSPCERSGPTQGSEKDHHREFVLAGTGCPPDRPAPSTSGSETMHQHPSLQCRGRVHRSSKAVRSSC